MIKISKPLLKFEKQGEKTGWTFIEIPEEIAQQLKPGNRQTFRVKGKIDNHKIQGVALLPVGGGSFIMPVNATMRKAIRKQKGAIVSVEMVVDNSPVVPPKEFAECLEDEPGAAVYFSGLKKSHKNYFIKWIDSAKTEGTRVKRIAHSITALSKRMDFVQMIRSMKKNKE